jgi:hypothetical protein
MSRLPITPDQAASINPTMAVPVGLALPDPSGKPFNLLPAEVNAKFAEKRIRNYLMVGGAALLAVIIALTVWRVLAVNSAQNHVSSLTQQLNTINNVEIPKYDKAVALKAAVTAQQAALKPLVANEVDWLTVLNQIATYQPTTATLTTLTLTGATPTATTGTAASTTTSAAPAASGTLGTASSSVTTPSVPDVTSWGTSLGQSPAFTDVVASGNLAPSNLGTVSFTGSWNIGAAAVSNRSALFSKPVP